MPTDPTDVGLVAELRGMRSGCEPGVQIFACNGRAIALFLFGASFVCQQQGWGGRFVALCTEKLKKI